MTQYLSQRDLRSKVTEIIYSMQQQLRDEIRRLNEIVRRQDLKIKRLEKEPITDVDRLRLDYEKLKKDYNILARKYEVDISKRLVSEVPEKFDTVEAISNYFKISQALLVGNCRRADIVKARHICCYVLYIKGMSLNAIGYLLNRDHSSIIHARNKVIDLLATNGFAQSEVDFINGLIKR